jgi:hypothetical protein
LYSLVSALLVINQSLGLDRQAEQVAYYLNNCPNLPASSFYNQSGRALPDIAAAGARLMVRRHILRAGSYVACCACAGENVQVFVNGSVTAVDGTSCSAPIVAGMVSLWNGLRLQAGKSPMGFINPFLYKSASYSSAFYDVTSGNNPKGMSSPSPFTCHHLLTRHLIRHTRRLLPRFQRVQGLGSWYEPRRTTHTHTHAHAQSSALTGVADTQ